MTSQTTYVQSKTLAAVKSWRATDKAKIAAPASEKDRARSQHRHSEQRLRECADQLIKGEAGQP